MRRWRTLRALHMTRSSGIRRSSTRRRSAVCARRMSGSRPRRPGGRNGATLSHSGRKRSAGARESRLCMWVVPVRGRPTMTIGAWTGASGRPRMDATSWAMHSRVVSTWPSTERATTRPSGVRQGSAARSPSTSRSGSRKSSPPKSLSPVRRRAARSNASSSSGSSRAAAAGSSRFASRASAGRRGSFQSSMHATRSSIMVGPASVRRRPGPACRPRCRAASPGRRSSSCTRRRSSGAGTARPASC